MRCIDGRHQQLAHAVAARTQQNLIAVRGKIRYINMAMAVE